VVIIMGYQNFCHLRLPLVCLRSYEVCLMTFGFLAGRPSQFSTFLLMWGGVVRRAFCSRVWSIVGMTRHALILPPPFYPFKFICFVWLFFLFEHSSRSRHFIFEHEGVPFFCPPLMCRLNPRLLFLAKFGAVPSF